MKTTIKTVYLLIIITLFASELNSQTKGSNLSKFILSLQTGFSFLSPTNPGQNVFTLVGENSSLNKSEIKFGFQFLNHHRVTLSVGKDDFNEEYDIYTGPPENPIFVQTSIKKNEIYWLGIYYSYHFKYKKVTPQIGIGTGLNDERKIINIYAGANIVFVMPISFDINLRYTKLFKTNNNKWFAKSIGSQIGIDLGINYEL